MLGKNLHLSQFVPATSEIAIPGFGTLGDVHIDTLVLTWGCMGFVLASAALVTPALVVEGPGGKGQAIIEMLYKFVDDLAHGQIGHKYRKFFPLIAAIFIFVLIANFSGVLIPGKFFESFSWWPKLHDGEAFELASPTTDFNVTLGLASIALITYLYSGFWAHGGKFLKVLFASPMSPIEWMDLVVRPSTLALRLLAVITADELMRGAFLLIMPFLLPTAVMGFELFIGVIQALVFALLTSIYIGLTVAEHH